jgi:WD40 repeat protein
MSKFFGSSLLVCWFSLILGQPGQGEPPPPKGEKVTEKLPSRTDLYGDPLPPGAIARLGTMRLRHEQGWFGTAFLDGGKILATGSPSGLRFWDTASGRLLTEIKGDFDSPLVPSADDKWLALRENEALSIREVPSGRLIRRWQPAAAKPGFGTPKLFSTDRKVLVEGGYEALRLWDTATGKEIRHFDAQNFHIGAAVFTHQGRRLVTSGLVHLGRGNRKGVICHWDLATGKLLQKTAIDIWPTQDLRLSHDCQLVAVSPLGGAVQLLDAETGKELRRLQGEKTGARRLAFSPDDRLLATNLWEEGKDNATISFWNPATGKLVRRFSIPLRVAEDIQFLPDGRTLLTQNSWVVRLWDVNTGKSLLDWPAHEGLITTLQYLPDGRSLISGSLDRTTRIWDVATGRQQRRLLPFFGHDSRLLPGGRAILSNSLPGAITVRDLETGKVLRRFPLEEQPQNSVGLIGLSSDGRTLTAYSSGPTAYHYHVWDFTTGRVLNHRPDTSGFSPSVFSADGKLAAGAHNTITFDEARKDKPFALQPEKTILIINVMTGRQLLSLPQPDQFSQAVAFSPDAQMLLTETSQQVLEGDQPRVGNHTLHLWELRSGKECLTIRGQKRESWDNGTAFSRDGRKLATARGAWTIQLWNLTTGKQLLRRSGYDAAVACLAISPDGKTLASGHNDSTILVWDIAEASRTAAAKAAANPKDLEHWWDDLAGGDAKKAHSAIWELAAHPEQAVALLRDRLKPAAAVPPDQFRQLLRDLDSKEFGAREAASKKLAEFADDVEPALQQALKVSKSAEQRRRIEALLAAPRIVPPGDKLRHLRAVEILEHIGAPEAQQVLQGLSKGAPETRLTQEAKASLERLNQRPISLP